jgi:hypothetical protein
MSEPSAFPPIETPRSLRFSPLMSMTLAALLLVNLTGAFALWQALLPGSPGDAAPNAEWRAPRLPQADAATKTDGDAYPQTLSRPLFSKSRQPSVVKSAAAAPALAAASSDLRLAAVVFSDDTHRAFVISASTPGGKWVALGDDIDGWTIARMQSEFVVLQNGDASVALKLYPPAGAGKRPPDVNAGAPPEPPRPE